MAPSRPGVDYTLNVSLEEMTLVKVVSTLLNKYSINLSMNNIRFIYDKWPNAVEEVVRQAMQLQLPHGLKRKVIGFIKPMCMEFFKWQDRFGSYRISKFTEEHFNMLCWTPQGTIDGPKTVRVLIEKGNLSIDESFGLACDCCLKEEILKIWKQIPKKHKGSYPKFCKLLDGNDDYITEFWYLKLKGQSDIFPSSYYNNVNETFETPIELSLFNVLTDYLTNVDATRYFLPKLTIEARKRILVVCAKDIVNKYYMFPTRNYENKWYGIYDGWCPIDVLCLLLSSMDKEQQIEVLRTPGALMFFLLWPYQDFFMPTANDVWPYLNEEDFYELLLTMCHKTSNDYKDYNYQNLLGLFWKQSPNSFKSYVRNDVKWLLLKLIALNDKENIALILKDATIKEKETIILECYMDSSICETLIIGSKFEILEMLVKECNSSNDAMIIFKKKCMERITCYNLERKFDCFIEDIEK